MFLIPPPPFSYESRCFPRFSTRRIIIQENTSLPPLSIFTRQEQLLSIICFQTGDFLDPHPPSLHSPPHIASCHLFSIRYGGEKKSVLTFPVPPAPFWYMCNLSKTSKDSCETNRASQTLHMTPPPHPLLIYYTLCAVHFSSLHSAHLLQALR